MDSRGRVLVIEDDLVISRSKGSIPRGCNERLVLRALDAGAAAGWPDWWKELAPLTRKEREFVRHQAPAPKPLRHQVRLTFAKKEPAR